MLHKPVTSFSRTLNSESQTQARITIISEFCACHSFNKVFSSLGLAQAAEGSSCRSLCHRRTRGPLARPRSVRAPRLQAALFALVPRAPRAGAAKPLPLPPPPGTASPAGWWSAPSIRGKLRPPPVSRSTA